MAGTIVLLLFGATHLTTVIKTHFEPPATPEYQAMEKAMRETVLIPGGPIKTTAYEAMNILTRSYSVLLIFVAVVDLLCWRAMAAAGRLGRLALANMVFSTILAIIPALALFPPPMAFGMIAAALFAFSWLAQRAPAQVLEPDQPGAHA